MGSATARQAGTERRRSSILPQVDVRRSAVPVKTSAKENDRLGYAALTGLDRFLTRARGLTTEDGQVLLDSLDVTKTDDPSDLAYHEANRKADRYIGEIRMQYEFRGEAGSYFGWLQIDAETLSQHATASGWRCEVMRQEERGDCLARLTRA